VNEGGHMKSDANRNASEMMHRAQRLPRQFRRAFMPGASAGKAGPGFDFKEMLSAFFQ